MPNSHGEKSNSHDLRVTKNTIQTTMSLVVGVEKGSLIDFETTGRPRIDNEHEVITLGYLQGNRLKIIQRKTAEKESFYNEVREVVQDLRKPFYSYNSAFEKDVLGMEHNDVVGNGTMMSGHARLDRYMRREEEG